MVSSVKSAVKNAAYLLIPVVLLLSAGIIAMTQESPFKVNNFNHGKEEGEPAYEPSSGNEPEREIPKWVKPARWFRSNSGGMPLEEMPSKTAAMREQYALVIVFTSSRDLPEHLRAFYNEKFFIEARTLYKDGKQDRTQWIFRDEGYGARLIAVLLEAAQDDNEDENSITGIKETKVKKRDPASGFIEIYDEKYHLTSEYRYSEKGEKSKIEYFYNNDKKISAQAMLWDDDEEDYIKTHTDYYRYNRSSFLRAVERVFLLDQQITSADNVIQDDSITNNGIINNGVKVSFPQNILAAAKNDFFMGEKFNPYPDFLGELFVLKDSKLIFTTDERGRVLEQTLFSDDEKKDVIWKIVNTWSGDRIVKITKTEGDTVLLTEYVYNNDGDRVLERNIRDGVLERVVRSDGKTDIEELYLNNKVILQAIWEDGRKISESRNVKN